MEDLLSVAYMLNLSTTSSCERNFLRTYLHPSVWVISMGTIAFQKIQLNYNKRDYMVLAA